MQQLDPLLLSPLATPLSSTIVDYMPILLSDGDQSIRGVSGEVHPSAPNVNITPNFPPSEESSSLRESHSESLQEENPPPYMDEIKVQPTVPSQSRRYDKKPLRNLPACMFITPGLFAYANPAIQPPPDGWAEFIHPEGQIYFYSPTRRIVTEANLRDAKSLRLILQAAARVEEMINLQQIVLSPHTELLLELGNSDSEPKLCRYYMLDHIRRVVFWLEQAESGSLELPPVASLVHLKHLLTQHYWNHVEFFPMHISLPASASEELVAILSHASVDYMTSDLSTVPYTDEQCHQYIRTIESMPESCRADGYKNCIIARLWSEISGNYYVNLRGDTDARLSRTQRLLSPPEVRNCRLLGLANRLSLRTAEAYYTVLCELWVDKVSYASHWRAFMKKTMDEWKQVVSWASLTLISQFAMLGLTFFTSSSSPLSAATQAACQTLSFLSTLFCIISITTSAVLARAHANHEGVSASEAADYLDQAWHQAYGLQPLAVIFALPWCTLLWGWIFLVLSLFLFSFSIPLLSLQIIIWTVITLGLFLAWVVTMFVRGGAKGMNDSSPARMFTALRVMVKLMMAYVGSITRVATMPIKAVVHAINRQVDRILPRRRSRGRYVSWEALGSSDALSNLLDVNGGPYP